MMHRVTSPGDHAGFRTMTRNDWHNWEVAFDPTVFFTAVFGVVIAAVLATAF